MPRNFKYIPFQTRFPFSLVNVFGGRVLIGQGKGLDFLGQIFTPATD